jgi:hypothetical protein
MTIGIIEMLLGVTAIYLGWSGLWFRTTGYLSRKELFTISVAVCWLAAGFVLMQWGLSRVDPIMPRTAI